MAAPHCSPYPDYFDFGSLLTEEQRIVADSVRDFVQKELEPTVGRCYIEERFPEETIPKLGQMGLLGANLSGYGCPGIDDISYGLIMRELERCDSGFRSFASVQGGLVMYPIYNFGSEEQKKEWLPKLAEGKAVGCFGLTESYGGSDPAAMKTTAKKKNGGWELNGSKMWITNGNIADVAVVWANSDDGVLGFLVPKDTKGYSVQKMTGKLSLRASVTSELYFDNVELPDSARLPNTQGMKSALSCLTQARYGIAWGAVGAAECCFDEAVEYVKTRKLFGKTLDKTQLVQEKLARMLSQITQSQLLVLRLGQHKSAGTLHFAHVSMAKQNNVEMALNAARTCRDILGANGIMIEYKSMRHMCNLESVFTYEGTNDIHLLIIGQQITGQGAY